MNRFSVVIFSLFLSLITTAQVEEVIGTLSERHIPAPTFKTTALDDTISIPFIDEFTQGGSIPSTNFWVDQKVYINSTHSKNPLSIGVATFDGLNKHGFPYHPTDNSSDTLADVLTSKYLDLRNENNVFLSFYYQSGGLGEAPGNQDSLVVEFWEVDSARWEQVWAAQGEAMDIFKPAIIAVDSLKWKKNGFRFRFGAYGARNGAFDIWNIDYVYISGNRNAGDSIIKDPAFTQQLPSIINNYSSVPWFHFNNSLLKDTVTTSYRRNGPTPSPPWSLTKNKHVLSQNGNIIQTSPGFVNSTDPHNTDLTNPIIINNFNPPAPVDSFNFSITAVLPGTKVEPFTANDTLSGVQNFKNYYAFDDGSAERAYGVKNAFGSRIAFRLNMLQPDTLKGIYFRFAHAGDDATQYTFKIGVWEYNQGVPGNLIYLSDSSYTPDYGYYHNSYMPYVLDSNLGIQGNVFVGIRQNTDQAIYMGLDMNTPKMTDLYYGDLFFWYESLVDATVMMRPYFKHQPYDLSQSELEPNSKLRLYPNPVDQTLFVDTESLIKYSITDLSGRIVLKGSTENGEIDVNQLIPGIYITLIETNGQYQSHKIIVQ